MEGLREGLLLIALFVFAWVFSVSMTEPRQKWLRTCAATTHGEIKRVPAQYTAGGSIVYDEFVLTKSGKRIDFLEKYDAE